MALLGALPLAYRPDAAEVAVIGFGTGMSSATLLGSPKLKRLDTIEIEPAMVQAAQSFRPLVDRAFTDARHRIVVEDAKAFLAKGDRRYDIIVSEPSNPWVSGVSSLFTQEFYARMRRHLKPGGVLVQWVHVYEITPQLVASIFRAMGDSFPAYEVWMGSQGDMVVVASPEGRLPAPSDTLYSMPAVKAMLERVGFGTPQRLALQWVADRRTLGPVLDSYGAGPNSDYFPLVDLNGPQARFMRASATALTVMHEAPAPLMVAISGRPVTGDVGEPPPPREIGGRQLPFARARQLVAYVRHGTLPPAGRSYISDYDLATVARNRLFTCEGRDLEATAWDGIVRIAAETLPYLPPADALAFWDGVRTSPCTKALNDLQKRWIDLFIALAGARWAEAAGLATDLLDEKTPAVPLTAFQRLYLAQAGAGALIATGRGPAATELVNAQLAKLPPAQRDEVWVRLALSHARLARP
jgi:hypothetical protein